MAGLVIASAADGQAVAADAVWKGSGTQPTNYSLSTNWTPSGPPSGTATFGPAAYVGTAGAPITGNNVLVQTWDFSTAVQTYYMQLTSSGGQENNFSGSGVVGSAANITNNAFTFFASSAGSNLGGATYTNNGTIYIAQGSAGTSNITNSATSVDPNLSFGLTTPVLLFAGNSNTVAQASAGSANITNYGYIQFQFSSTAATSNINNYNTLLFFEDTTAASSTITTQSGGRTYFLYDPGDPAGERPDGGMSRQIVKSGGTFDLSGMSDGSTCQTNGYACTGGTPPYGNPVTLTVGSIEGAGDIYLGANTLSAGGLNTNTEFSGVVHDGASPSAMADLGYAPAGSGSFNKMGTGTLILSGNNTYTGGTTISGGVLQLGNGGASGSILGNVSNGGALSFDRSDTYVFSGTISDNAGTPGSVTQIGSGTTVLTAANTYTGGTTISAGTLQLGNGGTSGSIVGNVVDNGVLAFDLSDTVTFAGVISGAGGVNQIGSGTTALTASNTYTGATNVNAGTLRAGAANVFSAASATTINTGGTLDLGTYAETINAVTLAGGTLQNGSLTGAVTSTGGYVNGITGSASFTTNGGTTTLTGTNGYTGATAINSGATWLAGANNSFSAASATTINIGGTLNLGGNAETINAVTLAGGTLQNGSLTGLVTSTGGTINGINGTTGFTANGGTTTLTGTNGYTGATAINSGATWLAGANNSFSAPSATTINTGGILNLGGYSETINAVTLAGGTLQNGSLAGAVTSTGGTVNGINGSAGFTANSGTTTLTGANGYTGTTAINNGATWFGGANNSFSAASTTTINTGGTLNLGTYAETINAITLARGTLQNGSLTGAVTSAGGTVNGITGSASFAANGGTTTLTGTNGYTGATIINSGAIWLAGANNSFSAASATTINTGGTLDLGTYAETINAVILAGGTLQNGSLAGAVTSTGGTVNGITGSASFTGNGGITTLTGTNGYTGTTAINNGATWLAGANNSFSAASSTTVNAGGTLNLDTYAETINAVTLAGGTLQNGSLTGAVTSSGGAINGINGTANFTANGGTTTLTGSNGYSGATAVNSGATWLAGANNSFSAASPTTINTGGTLNLGGYAETINAVTLAGGTLQIGSLTGPVTSTGGAINGINGTTGFTANGGTTTLTGANGYTGATAINSGATWLGGANNSFSAASATTVSNGGTLDLGGLNEAVGSLAGSGKVTNSGATAGTLSTGGNNSSTTFAGIIQNGASATALTKTGTGTFVLSGANSYTGATNINAGTLSITGSIDSAAIPGGAIGVLANATLSVGATGLINIAGSNLTNAGTVTVAAGGSLTDNLINSGVVNNAGSNNGAVQNASTGTITNQSGGQWTGAVASNSGTIANSVGATWIGNVTGNTATITNAGTWTGNVVSNTGTLTNNSIWTGTIANAGTFNNAANGTVSGQLINSAGTTTNGGQLNGGANVTGGTLTNNNLIAGNVGISGAGTVTNNLSINGAVSNAGTFNNTANGTLSGQLTNSAGITTNGGQLNGGANVTGGMLTNNNLIAGNVGISDAGTVANNLSINGAVSNAGIFDNTANGTVSGQFTNSAGTATNGGQLNGGANITGDSLTTTGTIKGGLTNIATVNANGGAINGSIVNNANGLFIVGGTVTSNSTFANAFGATLAVGASGAYTLQGMLTNSGVLNVAGEGQLTAVVGGITNTPSGMITVANGGTINDDLSNAGVVANNGAYNANVASNTGAGSITNAATGIWTGNVASNAVLIVNNGIWTGNVVSNTGMLNNNATWNGTIANSGTFINSASASVSGLVTNSGTTNNAGTLSVGLTNTAGVTTNNGSIGGISTITGGTLTGTGSVGQLTIASGGTFIPGNGTPGTFMTVVGNLAFQSGAGYFVQINPSTVSFAAVTGTASLGGATVDAMYANGNYVAKQYTILNAAGGVNGTFSSLVNTNLPANFTASLGYDPTHAYVDLALSFVAPPSGGLNGNQQSVANAIIGYFNRNGGIPMVFGGLTPGGLTQTSGEVATGSQQATYDAMNLFLGLLTDPFIAGRGDGATTGSGSSASAAPYAEEANAAIHRKAPASADTFTQRWSTWAAGYGGSQTTNGNATVGSNALTSQIYGTVAGADYRFSPFTLAGFAVAGGGTNFSIANGLGAGRSDLLQAGAFIRHTVGPAYVSAALAYGWQDVTTDRSVAVAGIDRLHAEFNANAFSGRIEGGYRYQTPWMGLTPYAAGQFTTYDLPSYAEQVLVGAGTFALNYAAQDVTDARSELGIRTDKSVPMQDATLILRGRFAWMHDFDTDRNILSTFQTLPGASFIVNGAAQAHDAALTTASAELKWRNGWSAAATFEGEFSGVTNDYAAKGVVRYAW